MDKSWAILTKMLLITILLSYWNPAHAQIPLPTIQNCPDDSQIPELKMQPVSGKDDTLNYCLLQRVLHLQSPKQYDSIRNQIPRLYQISFDSSRFEPAINYSLYGLELSLKHRDTLLQLQHLLDLSFITFRSGEFLANNSYIQKGKLLSRTIDNITFYADFLYREARLARILPDTKKAIRLITEYKNIIDSLPINPIRYFRYYHGIGHMERSLGNYKLAQAYGDSCLVHARQTGSKKLISRALASRSFYYALDKNVEIDYRIDLCKQAIAINLEMNDKEQLADNYNLLATHYYRDKQWSKAVEHYQIGFEYMKAIKDTAKMYNYYLGMYRTLDSMGLKVEAYQYKIKESEYYRKLYGGKNVVEIMDLHSQVTAALTEQQIQQLEYDKEIAELKNAQNRNNIFVILLLSLFVIGLLYFNQYRLRQRKNLEALRSEREAAQQIMELEKKALRAQMNPHFIFNSLNSIKSYIIKSEPRTAAKHLTKFAQLMRMILRNSEMQTINIAEELKALELYIQLEQFRLRNDFQYDIQVDPALDIERLQIPPLIIQPYVENAILHGLSNKQGKKQLNIQILNQEDHLSIVVRDNGVGRKANARSANMGEHKSFGMKITRERLEVNHPKATHPMVNINDLVHADGSPAGTEVNLILPLHNNIF